MSNPPCPKCGKETKRFPNMYGLDGNFYSGLVCCGSLWSDGDDEGFGEFMKHAKNRNTKEAE